MKDVEKSNIGGNGSKIECEIKDGICYLTIPLNQTYPKKEGTSTETINIATVGKPRCVHYEEGVFLGLTMYKYKNKR
ncbi:MAG: hypothetical protein M0R17_07275 [Candidatus Omnitrophica bacterium]|jgi:hypothetical protein|nr:hypothetical protein [Candidatus Omnitrophota bacterium]